MFPNAGSTIYRNDDGEVLGWDNNYADEPDYSYLSDEYDPYGPDDECPNPDCTDDLCDGSCEADDDDYQGGEDAWLDGSYEE